MSGATPALRVVEFTDPACPWAWSSEPTLRRLREVLGSRVAWRRVYGILFDDDDDPAPDPEAETAWYRSQLAEVSAHTGAPRPAHLRWVTRTSWPASLAAKAAEAQGPTVGARVLRRLRESIFVLGTPADTPDAVLAAVRGVAGLDHDRLARDLKSANVLAAVRSDWAETRTPCAEVLRIDAPGPHSGRAKPLDGGGHRYALPTLVFTGPAGSAVVPGWRDLTEYLRPADRVAPGSCAPVPLRTPEVALERYRSLTGPELRMLTGGIRAPEGAVRVETGNGPIWFHPAEAAVHPACVSTVESTGVVPGSRPRKSRPSK